jgi:hypothetical protein
MNRRDSPCPVCMTHRMTHGMMYGTVASFRLGSKNNV